MGEVENYKFRGVTDCRHCAYLEDCKLSEWVFCPYDGQRTLEKRKDDAEVF